MRIVFDASILCRRWHTRGGQQRYARELLLHLDTVASDDAYLLWFNFSHPGNLPLYRQLLAEMATTRLRYEAMRCWVPSRLLTRLRVPIERFTGPADVLHLPYSGLAYTRRAKRVVTIHDLIYFRHPECFSQDTQSWKAIVRKIAQRATLILTVSEYARGTIVEELGVPAERVRAIYHGVSPPFLEEKGHPAFEELQARWRLPRPYLLFVSTIQPIKNLPRLLEAFALLVRAELRGWHLVIAGQWGWMTESVKAAVEALGLARDVTFTGFVRDEELVTLYRHAELFVLPSLLEGFGIPVVEAMHCGVPVVASNTGALAEVVGDAGMLVDPYSVEDIARGILEVARDPELRSRLVARGAVRARRFRWEQTARETVAAYRDAVQMT